MAHAYKVICRWRKYLLIGSKLWKQKKTKKNKKKRGENNLLFLVMEFFKRLWRRSKITHHFFPTALSIYVLHKKKDIIYWWKILLETPNSCIALHRQTTNDFFFQFFLLYSYGSRWLKTSLATHIKIYIATFYYYIAWRKGWKAVIAQMVEQWYF